MENLEKVCYYFHIKERDVAMYTVLIVDKKKQMFHVYKHMLHWEKYQFEVISYTDSEQDALAYYHEYRHDLIISDTVLREGNGLSLLKELKKYSPSCHVILCSYDDDFEMIRAAWRHGCMDYLHKGRLKNSQLIENLEWINQRYKQHYLEMNAQWRSELQRLLGLIRDRQPIQHDDLYLLLKRPELSVLVGHYRILYFRMDNTKETFFLQKHQDREQLYASLKQDIEAECLVLPKPHAYLFSKMHSGMLILPNTSAQDCRRYAHNLIERIQLTHQIHVSIFISGACKGYEMFYKTYEQYTDSLFARFYAGDQSVIELEKLPTFQPLPASFTYKEQILHLLEESNFKAVLPRFQQLCEQVKKEEIVPEQVIEYCKALIAAIEKLALRKGIDKNAQLFEHMYATFVRIETYQMLTSYMTQMIQELLQWIQSSSLLHYNETVLDIIRYVGDHIDEKITLEDISKAIGKTAIHISRIFKKQMNQNLIYYINSCKMKRAVELMEDKERKLKDIAEAVGIEDQLYFNKVFRKFYHMSPRDYRKGL